MTKKDKVCNFTFKNDQLNKYKDNLTVLNQVESYMINHEYYDDLKKNVQINIDKKNTDITIEMDINNKNIDNNKLNLLFGLYKLVLDRIINDFFEKKEI